MRTRTAAAAALLCLALSACSQDAGGGSDRGSDERAASSAPANGGKVALEKAVRAYSAAYFQANAAVAWPMLSPRCRRETSPETYRDRMTAAAEKYGPQKITRLDVEVSGDMARVTYKYAPDPTLSSWRQPWSYEEGAWKRDAC